MVEQVTKEYLNTLEADDAERINRISDEWSRVEHALDLAGIQNTVVVFGSARIPKDCDSGHPLCQYYQAAYNLAFKLAKNIKANPERHDWRIVTGGGPGIMEAANHGAFDAGMESLGLNIVIPKEQVVNPYIPKALSFEFHYFAIRKMHFLKRAKAIVVFPGGFGTLDETLETLTLVQTKKIKPLPIILYSKDYWSRVVDFELLAEQGLIDQQDLQLFQVVDDIESAWQLVKAIM